MNLSSAPRHRIRPVARLASRLAGACVVVGVGVATVSAVGTATVSAAEISVDAPNRSWSSQRPMDSVPVGLRGAQSGPLADEPLAALARFALDTHVQVERSGDDTAMARFAHLRDAVAAQVAHRIDLEPLALQAAWARADVVHQIALLAALTQLGTPYHRYSETPEEGFDCSGLTGWAWAQSGVTLPRSSWEQVRAGAARTSGSAQAGDLVYYPGHVMMWLGVGRAVVHARQTGDPVMVDLFAERRVHSVRYASPTV